MPEIHTPQVFKQRKSNKNTTKKLVFYDTPSKTVPKNSSSYIRRSQFRKYVVFQRRWFYKNRLGNYHSKMVLQNRLYLLRSMTVLHMNRHCLFTFCQLFTTCVISFFHSFSPFFGKSGLAFYLLSLEEIPLSFALGKRRRILLIGQG